MIQHCLQALLLVHRGESDNDSQCGGETLSAEVRTREFAPFALHARICARGTFQFNIVCTILEKFTTNNDSQS